ncbi:MAG TPA: amidohydrolase family protein [Bacteroidales bacterium]|nr:amidohydrolase family protein [Bacteroidales bacterium]HSA43073.1 amidohydrolase family protein [Bacteroidales bacterium]
MRKISADWIFPVNGPPVYKGVLVLASDDSILDLLDPETVEVPPGETEHYDGILCPGFVNTHVHLELSHLQAYLDPGRGLDTFIRQINALYQKEKPGQAAHAFAMQAAVRQMESDGIVAAGDILGFDFSQEHREIKEQSTMFFHTFVEVFGSSAAQAGQQYRKAVSRLEKIRAFARNNQASLAPHATYSLSPELLILLKNHIHEEGLPTTLHHLENEDEVQWFRDGSGRIRERIRDFGIVLTHEPLRGDRPLAALANYLPSQVKILFVHNTAATAADILMATRLFSGAAFCFCPNANLFIENRLPDIRLFHEHHHRITLGTDSLASSTGLSILEEIKSLQKHHPELEFETLLRWGSLNGAVYLGIDRWAGSFEKGKNPGINLIEFFDTEKLRLTSQSRVRIITRSHPF